MKKTIIITLTLILILLISCEFKKEKSKHDISIETSVENNAPDVVSGFSQEDFNKAKKTFEEVSAKVQGEYENIFWKLTEDGKLYIFGKGNMPSWSFLENDNAQTPWADYANEIKNVEYMYGLTSVGVYCFSNSENLESIKTPATITEIEAEAFTNYKSLKRVEFHDNLTKIGVWSFACCESLEELILPENLKVIDNGAFISCTSLENISLPKTLEFIDKNAFVNTAFYNKDSNWENGALYLDAYLIDASKVSNSYTVKDGTLAIAGSAFSDNKSVQNIKLPNGVKYICRGTFSRSGISSITIPESVVTIGDYSFDRCESLVSINVDKNNQYYSSVDGVLFNKNKTALILYPSARYADSFSVPDGVVKIEANAFENTKLMSITLPDTLETLGEYAFSYSENLKSITIPNKVKNIPYCAFENSQSLQEVNLPQNLETLSIRSFGKCKNLEKIILPDSVKVIPNCCFEQCEKLADIVFPANLQLIEFGAFMDCSSLKTIDIPKGTQKIESRAFENCTSLETIALPDSIKKIDSYAFNNTYYFQKAVRQDGALYIGNYLIDVTSNGDVNIKNGTLGIASKAFDNSDNVSIYIPESVKYISEDSFYTYTVSKIKHISLSDANMYYKIVDNTLFTYDGSVLVKCIANNTEKTFYIPQTVNTVYDYALYDLISLESIVIPKSVTYIGMFNFKNMNSLSSVYYEGGIEDFEKIEILYERHAEDLRDRTDFHYNFIEK